LRSALGLGFAALFWNAMMAAVLVATHGAAYIAAFLSLHISAGLVMAYSALHTLSVAPRVELRGGRLRARRAGLPRRGEVSIAADEITRIVPLAFPTTKNRQWVERFGLGFETRDGMLHAFDLGLDSPDEAMQVGARIRGALIARKAPIADGYRGSGAEATPELASFSRAQPVDLAAVVHKETDGSTRIELPLETRRGKVASELPIAALPVCLFGAICATFIRSSPVGWVGLIPYGVWLAFVAYNLYCRAFRRGRFEIDANGARFAAPPLLRLKTRTFAPPEVAGFRVVQQGEIPGKRLRARYRVAVVLPNGSVEIAGPPFGLRHQAEIVSAQLNDARNGLAQQVLSGVRVAVEHTATGEPQATDRPSSAQTKARR
jgi:hypothetical protein